MADADWDADDFEPTLSTTAVKSVSDKWEGEDEDDDVKDAWDKDSDDDSQDSPTTKAVQRKKKKKLADILAEKEASKLKEAEALAEKEATLKAANTPEAKNQEKLRQLKMQEQMDRTLAKEMCGMNVGSIDAMIPVSKEEFDQLEKAIVEKVQTNSTSEHYPELVEGIVKDLCIDMSVATLKKIKIHVETLHSTKLRDEKASKSKKAKGKSTVKMDLDKDIFGGGGGGGGGADYDDLDDIM